MKFSLTRSTPKKRKADTQDVLRIEHGLVGWSEQFDQRIKRVNGVVPRYLRDYPIDMSTYTPLDLAIYKGMPRAVDAWLSDF